MTWDLRIAYNNIYIEQKIGNKDLKKIGVYLDKFINNEIPDIPQEDMILIIKYFAKISGNYRSKFNAEKIMIVGDIHGSLESIRAIFEIRKRFNCGCIFLGDYLDRGNNSIEVYTMMMLIKIFYPK